MKKKMLAVIGALALFISLVSFAGSPATAVVKKKGPNWATKTKCVTQSPTPPTGPVRMKLNEGPVCIAVTWKDRDSAAGIRISDIRVYVDGNVTPYRANNAVHVAYVQVRDASAPATPPTGPLWKPRDRKVVGQLIKQWTDREIDKVSGAISSTFNPSPDLLLNTEGGTVLVKFGTHLASGVNNLGQYVSVPFGNIPPPPYGPV